jgi:hypothetical protein
MRLRLRQSLLALAALLAGATPTTASVSDVTIADVTTRAFSVVWVSSEPVTSATVHVFSDTGGTVDITSTLTVTLVSAAFPPALAHGVVKVDVAALAADSTVFVQTTTTGASGTVLFPTSPPFLAVHTALQTTKANDVNKPIVNDLIQHNVFAPDGTTPATGALLVLSAPNLGASPLTVFVGQGFPAPAAVIDLNNLYQSSTGTSAEVAANQNLTLTEFRGLLCPGLSNHKLIRLRRAPAHEETPPITEVEAPVPCFFADTVCDNTINILDAQRVLNIFGRTRGECAFNPDLDIVADDTINILDVQGVLNRFGQSAPFPP